jgi:hypothetical protein
MGARSAATASVSLEVTEGSPSVYVPAVFDAREDNRVLKAHTTWAGAWAAAEKACAEDLALCRFEVWEMELVIDGAGSGPGAQGPVTP